MRQIYFSTYSIAAFDPTEHAWGVAVASKFLAAGAVVAWAQAKAGAIATQALANVTYGPEGLAMMAAGLTAEQTLEKLLAGDPNHAHRQVGLVDKNGGVVAYTGRECNGWAGHKIGKGYTCQGNILTGGNTLEAMAEAFETADGELADRLIAALLAGDTVGGDSRGKQAAAVYVVKPNGGYGGDNEYYLDLRVDDDPDPVHRLAGLVKLHHFFFGASKAEDLLPVDTSIAIEIQTVLKRLDYYQHGINGQWDEATRSAFWAFCGVENLEERWSPDKHPELLDRVVLEFIRERFGVSNEGF